MNLYQPLVTQWNNFFFQSQDQKNFPFFRFIVFIYIFLFAGYNHFTVTSSHLQMWSPVSFYQLLDLHTWVTIVTASYYILKITSLFCALNIYYKFFSKLCFISALFNLGFIINFGKVFHGHHMLIIVVGLLAFIHNNKCKENLWPLQLIKLYCASVYFMAGLNKIFESGLEWVFSENFYRMIAGTPGKTELAKTLLNQGPILSTILAFCAIFLFQIPSIIAAFNKFFGIYLFIAALSFHMGVHLIFGGHYAFLSQIVCVTIYLPLDRILSPIVKLPPLTQMIQFFSSRHINSR